MNLSGLAFFLFLLSPFFNKGFSALASGPWHHRIIGFCCLEHRIYEARVGSHVLSLSSARHVVSDTCLFSFMKLSEHSGRFWAKSKKNSKKFLPDFENYDRTAQFDVSARISLILWTIVSGNVAYDHQSLLIVHIVDVACGISVAKAAMFPPNFEGFHNLIAAIKRP
jgi:hypothetical protein